MPAANTLADFFDRFEVTDTCWNWTRGLNSDGYGVWTYQRKNLSAHRFMWEMVHGTVPEGLELDHACDNRRCVNPDHLRPMTHAENMARSLPARKTHCKRNHEFTPENTRYQGTDRACRACMGLATRAWEQRNHERTSAYKRAHYLRSKTA